jgi:hypothetical protein
LNFGSRWWLSECQPANSAMRLSLLCSPGRRVREKNGHGSANETAPIHF